MCGGSTSVNYPGPTPQEQELQQMQLDNLKQQNSDISSFKPFVLKQYGLEENPNYNAGRVAELQSQINSWKHASSPTGENRQFTDEERSRNAASLQQQLDDYTKANPVYQYTAEQIARNKDLQAAQDQALELQKAQGERQKQALAGTLPLSQQLTQQRDLDFKALQEDQAKNGNEVIGDNLDNAVAKTTSGQQALDSLRKTYGLLVNQEQNAAIQQANLPGVYASQYQVSSANANPGAPANMYSSLTPGFAAAYQPYQSQQAGQFQANATNASNNQSFTNTLLTGLLNGGARLGAAAAA